METRQCKHNSFPVYYNQINTHTHKHTPTHTHSLTHRLLQNVHSPIRLGRAWKVNFYDGSECQNGFLHTTQLAQRQHLKERERERERERIISDDSKSYFTWSSPNTLFLHTPVLCMCQSYIFFHTHHPKHRPQHTHTHMTGRDDSRSCKQSIPTYLVL